MEVAGEESGGLWMMPKPTAIVRRSAGLCCGNAGRGPRRIVSRLYQKSRLGVRTAGRIEVEGRVVNGGKDGASTGNRRRISAAGFPGRVEDGVMRQNGPARMLG